MLSHSLAAVVALAALLPESVIAAIHTVKVGDGGLTFDPNTVVAEKGDTVTFDFYPKNHSVVAGNPDKGCTPSTTDLFYSGYVPVASGKASTSFSILINNTDPISFYCSQGRHCQSGMVGVINPTDKVSLKAYEALAAAAKENEAPAGGVVGGTLHEGAKTVTAAGQSATASASSGSATAGSNSTASPTGSSSSSGYGSNSTSGSSSSSNSTTGGSTSSGLAVGMHAEVGGLIGVLVGFIALMGI